MGNPWPVCGGQPLRVVRGLYLRWLRVGGDPTAMGGIVHARYRTARAWMDLEREIGRLATVSLGFGRLVPLRCGPVCEKLRRRAELEWCHVDVLAARLRVAVQQLDGGAAVVGARR